MLVSFHIEAWGKKQVLASRELGFSKAVESSVFKNVQKKSHISCVSVLWPCDFSYITCETHLKCSVLFVCLVGFFLSEKSDLV